MSLRNYVSIVFSEGLAQSDPEKKIDAILKLKDYLETNHRIWTGYDDTLLIAEAAKPYLSGGVDLTINFCSEVIAGDLTDTERQSVEAFGFDTRVKRGLAFCM